MGALVKHSSVWLGLYQLYQQVGVVASVHGVEHKQLSQRELLHFDLVQVGKVGRVLVLWVSEFLVDRDRHILLSSVLKQNVVVWFKLQVVVGIKRDQLFEIAMMVIDSALFDSSEGHDLETVFVELEEVLVLGDEDALALTFPKLLALVPVDHPVEAQINRDDVVSVDVDGLVGHNELLVGLAFQVQNLEVAVIIQ